MSGWCRSSVVYALDHQPRWQVHLFTPLCECKTQKSYPQYICFLRDSLDVVSTLNPEVITWTLHVCALRQLRMRLEKFCENFCQRAVYLHVFKLPPSISWLKSTLVILEFRYCTDVESSRETIIPHCFFCPFVPLLIDWINFAYYHFSSPLK